MEYSINVKIINLEKLRPKIFQPYDNIKLNKIAEQECNDGYLQEKNIRR